MNGEMKEEGELNEAHNMSPVFFAAVKK